MRRSVPSLSYIPPFSGGGGGGPYTKAVSHFPEKGGDADGRWTLDESPAFPSFDIHTNNFFDFLLGVSRLLWRFVQNLEQVKRHCFSGVLSDRLDGPKRSV